MPEQRAALPEKKQQVAVDDPQSLTGLPSPIEDAVCAIECRLNTLNEGLDVLNERLSPVYRFNSLLSGDKDKEAVKGVSQLHGRLLRLDNVTIALIERISLMCDSLTI